MILGSHNTMTYLKPRKWWMWFGKFIAKCQKLNIQQQYDKGARWFDLRISFPKDRQGNHGEPVFSHGVMDYKGISFNEVCAFLSSKDDVFCRIILEKGGETEEMLFKFWVSQMMTTYTNLKITQIAKKKKWVNILEPNSVLPFDSKDLYASVNGYYPQYENWPGILSSKSWSGYIFDDLYPWIYAKFHNKKNIEKHKDENIVLLIDFVGCF